MPFALPLPDRELVLDEPLDLAVADFADDDLLAAEDLDVDDLEAPPDFDLADARASPPKPTLSS